MIDQEYKKQLEEQLSSKQLIDFNLKILDFLGKSYNNGQDITSFDNDSLFPRKKIYIYDNIKKTIFLYKELNYHALKANIIENSKEIEVICLNLQKHIERINTLNVFADEQVASKETCEYYLEYFNQVKYIFTLMLEEINTSKIKLKDIFDEIKC